MKPEILTASPAAGAKKSHLGRGWRLCPGCDCFIQVNLDGRFRRHFYRFNRNRFKQRYCKGGRKLAVNPSKAAEPS